MRRERPNKKWTDDEVIKLLDYMNEAACFEAPSAQAYYRKCIEVTGINATPNLLRWKVRHLRAKYEKTKEWRNSLEIEQELDTGAEKIKEKMLRMCPHYSRLELVFGSVGVESIEQTTDIQIKNEKITEEDEDLFLLIDSPEHELTCESPFSTVSKMETDQIVTQNGMDKEGITMNPADFQSEQLILQRIQIEFEKLKYEERKILQREQIKFQRQKFEAEMELKREEINIEQQELRFKILALDRDERLRKLEIEKDERVAKYELYLKYKINNISK